MNRKQSTTRRGAKGKAAGGKKRAGVLDLAAAQEESERAARLVAQLCGAEGVPDYIHSAVYAALIAAGNETGIVFRDEEKDDFDLKGLAALLAATRLYRLELEPKRDLAELISAVLKHPDVPQQIYNGLSEGVSSYSFDADSAAFIRLALASAAQEEADGQKGGSDE